MNILILGATGRVGKQLLNYALQDKHNVTILVRNPEKIQIEDANLTVIKGNVLDSNIIGEVVKGQDVVISALNTDGVTTLSDSMPFIIREMVAEGVKRIITIGTGGILQSRVEPHLLRYQSSESKRKSTTAAEDHHKVFNILEQSDIDWTIVCPTYLPDGEHLGNYRVERNFLPDGGVEISVYDTAEFAYKQIESRDYIKTRVGIAY
ncbi:MAG: hypothetical protein K0S51_2196 [Bacillales bacterium]|jgi:putative NADH-flavin reductase|nr:hypothetical protein [Bacillales bacterium]